jgi:FMN phosphatase YigB (HAD superfamily)
MAHVGDLWEQDFLAPKEAGIKAFHLDRKVNEATGAR